MTGFGNARLAGRDEVRIEDLPRAQRAQPHRLRAVDGPARSRGHAHACAHVAGLALGVAIDRHDPP